MVLKNKFVKAVILLILIIAAGMILLPVLSLLNISLKSIQEYLSDPAGIVSKPKFSNFIAGWKRTNMSTFFLNSIFYTVAASVLVTLLSLFVAFPIQRKKLVFHKQLYALFCSSLMLPPALIPLYAIMKNLHLTNTYYGMVLFYAGILTPFTIFLLTGFVKTVPVELDEAADVDGCGYFRYVISVVLPLMKPAVATVVMLQALTIWNDFVNPYLFLSKPKMRNLASGLYILKGEFSMDMTVFAAAVLIVLTPITIAYILLQKQITEGISAGAIKG